MKKHIETFQKETDFRGLNQLLVRNLYPKIMDWIRELIQNGGDSITLLQELLPHLVGKIEIFTHPAQNTLIIKDNGLGMGKEEIKNQLSRVCSSGTGQARQRLTEADIARATELIGQFGIGILSAFMVADKLIVRTRKHGSDTAYEWHNDGSNECQLYECDKKDVGTEVILIIKPECVHLLGRENMWESIRKYCDFFRFPVFLNDEGPVNTIDAPWHRQGWKNEEEKLAVYRAFLNDRFPDFDVLAIPVEIEGQVTVQGALYITQGKVPDLNSNGCVDLYNKRMLIRERVNDLLPPWAPFIGGIIDCPDLVPTAARDNVQRNEPSFELVKKELAQVIIDFLLDLAENHPEDFAKVNECHHYYLVMTAMHFPVFFEHFADKINFNTNRGLMNLAEYEAETEVRTEDGRVPIYYTNSNHSRRMFREMADRKNMVVLDCTRSYEEDLLMKYVEQHKHRVMLSRIDVGSSSVFFEDPTGEDLKLVDRLEVQLLQALSRGGFRKVDIQVKRFLPEDVASLVLATPEALLQRDLKEMVKQSWVLGSFGKMAEHMGVDLNEDPPVRLLVNLNNELVELLGRTDLSSAEAGDALAVLVFDRPAGEVEMLGDRLRRYAAECKKRLILGSLGLQAGLQEMEGNSDNDRSE
jgi:molecular chaperone HtpG